MKDDIIIDLKGNMNYDCGNCCGVSCCWFVIEIELKENK